MKKLQKEREEQQKNNPNVGSVAGNNTSVAFLRAKKDLSEYEDIPGVVISYSQANPMEIALTVTPDTGYYQNGVFHFKCTIPKEYPNTAPEFRCLEKIYHPNIDLDGHVCLNILRNDWKPTLTLQLIFAGILHLFLQPNPNDPLNKDAANELAKFPNNFARNVKVAMAGNYVNNERFTRVSGSFY